MPANCGAVRRSHLSRREDPTSNFTFPTEGASASPPRRVKVFIVEHNPADLFVVKEVIEACSFESEIHVAADGEVALTLLQALDADQQGKMVILLDLDLPKVSGPEVLAYIRATPRYRDIPVVITASSDSPVDLGVIAESGATAYF